MKVRKIVSWSFVGIGNRIYSFINFINWNFSTRCCSKQNHFTPKVSKFKTSFINWNLSSRSCSNQINFILKNFTIWNKFHKLKLVFKVLQLPKPFHTKKFQNLKKSFKTWNFPTATINFFAQKVSKTKTSFIPESFKIWNKFHKLLYKRKFQNLKQVS